VKVGIEFAKKKGFDFKVYEDEGKSGYKIKDDDDLFANRPGFLNLLDDIKTGIIDKVWVWEQSRLSRNQLSTAHIFSIFQKNKITLFEKNK
jgi:DNA invertase Pin-like site-specific DNA recombinase